MNQTRTFLLVAWFALAFLLWQDWQQDHAAPATVANPPAVNANAIPAANASVPASAPAANAANATPAMPPPATAAAQPSAPPVILDNDVLRLRIDPRGASVIGADLLAYGQTNERGSPPVTLLDDDTAHVFVVESGLVSANNAPAPNHLSLFQAEGGGGEKTLANGSESISQSFVWTDAGGMQVRKTYTLHRGSYAIDVREQIRNGSAGAWVGNTYRQLRRVPPVYKKNGGLTNPESYSFAGAAWYSPEDKFEKRAFDKFGQALDKTVTGGWVAMLQHYFLAAWIPDAAQASRFTLDTTIDRGQTTYLVREQGPQFKLAPGASAVENARLYVGPKLQNTLPGIAPGLDLTVDYGMFTVIAQPLYWLLSKLHWLIGNWGWAIVALVLLLKLAMYKLSEAQYRNMAKMRALQPRLEALKERYGDDKQQYQMAMLEFYKKEKINPAGGCLPMLIPIPVFLALYWVLLESVELRHAPWMGWIHSLSDKDPYFVLPVLYMAVMYLTQRLSPTPGMDPMQRKMLQIMPLTFGVMFAFFPAGLVLYWVTNGSLGLLQQWWLMRQHGAPAAAPRA
jgi:YidC/Oxa1 family membrane protein insertase